MAELRQVLLTEADVQDCVTELARRIAPHVGPDTIAVCLLTGGLWFAADLMRALARRDCHPIFDALWMSSYGDAHASSGQVNIRTGLQRSVAGIQVLLIDDVFDSGLSLSTAKDLMTGAGASSVLTAVFARKPWATPRTITPDFVAWEAPDAFLVGYGMDDAGRYRGLPGVEAVQG